MRPHPSPDFSIVSIVASAANAQQLPRPPWSLTGVTQPLLAEFQYAGKVSAVERRSGARRADSSSRTLISFPGAWGRRPGVNEGALSAKAACAAKTTKNGSIGLIPTLYQIPFFPYTTPFGKSAADWRGVSDTSRQFRRAPAGLSPCRHNHGVVPLLRAERSLLMAARRGVGASRAVGRRAAPNALVRTWTVSVHPVRSIRAPVTVARRTAPFAVLLVVAMLVNPVRAV